MTGADFAAWVAAMKATRKWTKTRCAKELGCGTLHSEDLNPGQASDGVQVRNPFLA